MIIAIDVAYHDTQAIAAAVLFADWQDAAPCQETSVAIAQIAQYVPGQFYMRELPCIVQLLQTLEQPPECIVIDGYVTLGREAKPGLGMHLWQFLEQKIPVIGVAKTAFDDTPEESKLLRGNSARPLFVSTAGLPLAQAKQHIAQMQGKYRMPDLLKRADQLCRQQAKLAWPDADGDASASGS